MGSTYNMNKLTLPRDQQPKKKVGKAYEQTIHTDKLASMLWRMFILTSIYNFKINFKDQIIAKYLKRIMCDFGKSMLWWALCEYQLVLLPF